MHHAKKVACSVMAIIAVVLNNSDKSHNTQQVGDVFINNKLVGHLIVSPAALKVIGDAESCMRTPYRCPAGLTTDGIGNTHRVTGKIKSDHEIAVDWTENIITAQNCLTASTNASLMSQGQIDAFTSFIFNTGCTRFKRNSDGSETRIFKNIQNHHFDAACYELHYWVYANGNKLPGLVNRRKKETELCLAH